MFSIDDPEISAEDLTRSVSEEARRRQAQSRGAGNGTPPVDGPSAQRWAAVHRALVVAESRAVVGEQLPPMHTLHGIRRRLAAPIARLILRAAQLVTREQTSFNTEAVRALHALTEAASLNQFALEQRLVTAFEERVRVLGEEMAGLRTEIGRLADEFARHGQTLHDYAASATERTDSLERVLWTGRQESAARFEANELRLAEAASRMQAQLLAHERQLRALADLRPARERAAAAPPGDAGLDHLLDTFYAAFENRFRGSREEIKARLGIYLADVRAASAGTTERPVLDLGCGRGEWLELLADQELVGAGVDTNLAMVTEGHTRGLRVVEGDALAHLRSLPDGSHGAVTAFHLVEHLPFGIVIQLIDEIVRVLQPGGIAILETPNPQNLVVGACSFYMDPTHRRPLHPETMRFLGEARGLERVEIRPLHPVDAGRFPDDGSDVTARLNAYLHGPQDYAVLGHRA